MRSSWRLARNELARRRSRSLLLVAASSLAVALVVMATSLIGSVQAGMEVLIKDVLGAADARVVHLFNGRFDAEILETIEAWPEVEAVTGRLLGSVTLVHADGKVDPETERPYRMTPLTVGMEPELEPRFRQIEMIEGRRPEAAGEVILDPLTSDGLAAGVGDELIVQRFGEPIELTVVGIYARPRLGTLQRPLIRMDRRTLAEAQSREGQLTSVAIILREGVDAVRFCERHEDEVEDVLSLEPAHMIRTGFDRRVRASRVGIVIGSILTFMAATFIIVTGMTTGVTERQREMAILRCLGAWRRQLFVSQVLYGLTIGVVGAVVGVPLGLALGSAIAWHFRDLLPAGFAPVPLGMWLAVIGSCAAGLIGASYPAWQASRVSPLVAMTTAARPVRRRSVVLCTVIGLLLIAGQLAMMRFEDPQVRFWSYAWVGLPVVFTGYFLLSVPVTLAVSTVVAPVLGRLLRLPSGMIVQATRATPFRHGFTGGALMVGIALLVAEWSGVEALLDDWVNNIRFADGFAIRTTGITKEEQQQIDALPFVTESCPIGYLPAPIVGQRVFGVDELTPRNVIVVGFEPQRFFDMNEIEWHEGDEATALPRLAGGDGVLVADRFLTARDIGVGDSITLGAGRVQHEYEIVGVVSSAGLDIATEMFGIRNAYTEYSFSCVFMDFRTVVEHFGNDDALIVQVNLEEDIDDEAASEQLEAAVPGVIFRSGRWIRETINEIAYGVVAVQTAVAACALLLACLGVGNVILANIHSRRYEYGVLRAVGAHRGLLARLVLTEATLFAIVGSLVGTTLGMQLAWVSAIQQRDLLGLEITAGLPELPTLLGCLTMLLLTLAAAIPGVTLLVRPSPSKLLAAGRAG